MRTIRFVFKSSGVYYFEICIVFTKLQSDLCEILRYINIRLTRTEAFRPCITIYINSDVIRDVLRIVILCMTDVVNAL